LRFRVMEVVGCGMSHQLSMTELHVTFLVSGNRQRDRLFAVASL
jgi:hypothetical protein